MADNETNQVDDAEQKEAEAPSESSGATSQKPAPGKKGYTTQNTAKGDYADIMNQAVDELVKEVYEGSMSRMERLYNFVKDELNEYADEIKEDVKQMYSQTKDALKSMFEEKDEDEALKREDEATRDEDMSQARSMMTTPDDSPLTPSVEMSGMETQRLDERAAADAEAVAGPVAGEAVQAGTEAGKIIMTG